MHPTERDKRAVLLLVEQGFATIERIVETMEKSMAKIQDKSMGKT